MDHRKRLVAVHQPNFFPWLGYFNKIARADVFVMLDTVQFPKGGGSWLNRVKIMVEEQPHWMTLPVMRDYHGTRSIHEISIDERKPWQRKMLNMLMLNYARSPFFDDIFPFVSELINIKKRALRSYNISVLHRLADLLQLNWSKVVPASELVIAGKATDLLISIVQAVNGTTYLAGGGAEGYQEDHKFADTGISLCYQNFKHPVYPQHGVQGFVPGLSVLDALFNVGPAETSRLIQEA